MNTARDALLHDVISPQLEGQERVLWAGRPDLRRTALAMIGQLLIGAVLLLLLFLAYVASLPASGSLIGPDVLLFVRHPGAVAFVSLLVLYVLFQPVFSYWTATTTVYAVTDKRVLSLTRGCLARSIWYEDMQAPLLEPGTGDRRDIHFNGRVRADGSKHRPHFSHFLGIEGAESVHQLIIEKMTSADDGRKEDRVAEDYLELLLRRKGGLEEDLSRAWGPAGADEAYQLLHSQRSGPAKG